MADADNKGSQGKQAPAKGGAGGGDRRQNPLAADISKHSTFLVILGITLVVHIGVMIFLGSVNVPEDAAADPSQMPERFAKLIVPDQEPEPEEEASGAGEEQEQPKEQPEEQPEEEAGGGDEPKEEASAAPKSEAEIREKVRTKGILAVFASKKKSGGALSDVLSEGGVAKGLDQALGDVGGVVTAKRGMDVRGPRGAGGGKSADIGDLEAGAGRGMGLGDKAAKKVEAGVKTASFTSQGSLSAEAIRAVVQKEIRGVKYCYEKELAKNPELQGKVVVKFTIGLSGRVDKYEIESSSMDNAEVEGCILKRLRRWRFPKPEKDAVTVSYPFIFTATG